MTLHAKMAISPIYYGTFISFVLSYYEIDMNENFNYKTTILSPFIDHIKFQGYRCKSGIAIFELRVTWNSSNKLPVIDAGLVKVEDRYRELTTEVTKRTRDKRKTLEARKNNLGKTFWCEVKKYCRLGFSISTFYCGSICELLMLEHKKQKQSKSSWIS